MRREVAADAAQPARQLVALALLCVFAVAAWASLIAFAASPAIAGGLTSGSTGLGDLVISLLAAKLTIERGRLLDLAQSARVDSGRGKLGPWRSFFVHFGRSLAALGVACCVGWIARDQISMWWLEPYSWAWPGMASPPLYPDDPRALGRVHAVATLATVPLFALPFFADDVWRLLLPLTEPKAKKLRMPFVLVTCAAAFVSCWGLRSVGPACFADAWQFAGIQR